MDAIDPLSFDYSWPGLLEIFEALSQVMVLLGQSLSSNSLTVINELNPLETELGLVRNKLGTYQILIDVLLRSAWEDIIFFASTPSGRGVTNPSFIKKNDTALTSLQVEKMVASSLNSIEPL